MTLLCEIAYKYGTDKCPKVYHSYTPFYYELLKDKQQTIKKVLELGIGYQDNIRHVSKEYQKGASLYMWRDFFPNAQIYGADINSNTLFKDERIETFLCDERKPIHLKKLIERTGSDIDLFIDDGSHLRSNQIRTCKTLMPLFQKDVIYIIEDSKRTEFVRESLSEYDCQIFKFPNIRQVDDNIILVKNKHD